MHHRQGGVHITFLPLSETLTQTHFLKFQQYHAMSENSQSDRTISLILSLLQIEMTIHQDVRSMTDIT